jgi:dTDP-4-amino-4,6-dideoxy-D-galactose acyltransferase
LKKLELLNWDSSFFGFPVAKVVAPDADEEDLQAAVSEMRLNKIPLAYWAANKTTTAINERVVKLGGQLVDEKLTFVAKLTDQANVGLRQTGLVETYCEGMSLGDLKQLAVDSGVYSRFVVDPKFPQDKARALYEEWMLRSVDKSVADEVLVIRQSEKVAGMATVVRAGERGSIGLISVAKEFRGQKFGETLVRAAQIWWRERGCDEIQVVTQQANVVAQNLYRKCGFEVKKTEYYYHIWA